MILPVVVETLTVSTTASVFKSVQCEHCGSQYHYVYRRACTVSVKTYYAIDRTRQFEGARRRSQAVAVKLALNGIAPVVCPNCGKLQSNMVPELKQRKFNQWAPLGWIGPMIVIGINALIVLLNTDFFSEPLSSGWFKVITISVAASIACIAIFGVKPWLEGRTISTDYFGSGDVPIGQAGLPPTREVELVGEEKTQRRVH